MSTGAPGPHGAAASDPRATVISGNVRADFFSTITVVQTTLADGRIVVVEVDTTTGAIRQGGVNGG